MGLAACGESGSDDSTATTDPISTSTTGSTVAPTNPTASTTTSTSIAPTTTTTAATTTTTTIPGGPIDFGPNEGDVLSVIGVAHDDVLNLRQGPSPSQPILAGIDPLYDGLVARGNTWQTPTAFWIEVDYEGATGWVHMSFIAYLGATDDTTAFVIEQLGGYPEATSMSELGLIVASVYESEEPASDVVMTVAPTTGDLGEVTYDVVGIGDDASRGFRLHVFGEPTVDGFVLKAVELTDLCGRGVTGDGLCV